MYTLDLVTFLLNKYVTVEGVKIGSEIWKKVKWDLLNKLRMYFEYFVFGVLRVNIGSFESFSSIWDALKVKNIISVKITSWKFQINVSLVWKCSFRCQTWRIQFIQPVTRISRVLPDYILIKELGITRLTENFSVVFFQHVVQGYRIVVCRVGSRWIIF